MALENIINNLKKNKNKFIACSLIFFWAYLGCNHNIFSQKNIYKGYNWYNVKTTSFDLKTEDGCRTGCVSNCPRDDLYAALPGKGLCGKKILVQYNNKQIILPVIDVGPWFIDDDYWNGEGIPYSQKKSGKYRITKSYKDGTSKTPVYDNLRINKAGIDLSKKAWEKLGINLQKGIVDIKWRFID